MEIWESVSLWGEYSSSEIALKECRDLSTPETGLATRKVV